MTDSKAPDDEAAPPTAHNSNASDGAPPQRTEKEKMLAGDLYLAFEPQLTAERFAARRLLRQFNDEHDENVRLDVLRQLLGG